MSNTAVYTQSEKFRSGWISGFYDALSDDGLRYLGEVLVAGPRDDAQCDFLAGYLEGLRVRRGQSAAAALTSIAMRFAA